MHEKQWLQTAHPWGRMMHMETSVAKQLSEELNDIIGRLDESIRLVMDQAAESDFIAYRSAVGRVMGVLVLDVLNPLYASNPEVKPEGYDDE
jgi:hypothetical protein